MIVLLAIAALAAPAEERRWGVFVGNNHGAPTDLPLHFAVSDAKKMRDLFVADGGVRLSDATLLADTTRRGVDKALARIHSEIVAARNDGQATSVVFYYSGHADDEGLHLGASELPWDSLRSALDDTGADVRLALFDACQSGAALRAKGGQRGAAFDFAVQVERTQGTAILTSSAASELSQESAEVGGGFFTHYLHTALIGAADGDGDGQVTLHEAYAYVHGETAFGTRGAAVTQTPSFDLDLTGAGALVLTQRGAKGASLVFDAVDGTLAVWDAARRRYVAEVDGPANLTVERGTYYVHRRLPGWVDEARYELDVGESVLVALGDFTAVAYDDTAARGELARQERRATRPALSLRLATGARGFGGTVDQQYLPGHAVAGVQARWLPQRGTWFGADVLTGAGGGSVTVPGLGEVPVFVSSSSIGASVGYATPPWWIRAGVGGRVEAVLFRRSFPDGTWTPQATPALAPGVSTWIGLHPGRVSLDVELDLLMATTQFDDLGRFPWYGELLLAVGYRF